MLKSITNRQSFEAEAFDMTPIIDVVFLLIIFFMLVCQFMAAEQFQVQVPDAIESAQQPEVSEKKPVTITVMARAGETIYAIGSQKLGAVQGSDLAELTAAEVDRLLSEHQSGDRTVRLRCDKSVTFGQVKHILAGLSKSSAASLDWAVLGE